MADSLETRQDAISAALEQTDRIRSKTMISTVETDIYCKLIDMYLKLADYLPERSEPQGWI